MRPVKLHNQFTVPLHLWMATFKDNMLDFIRGNFPPMSDRSYHLFLQKDETSEEFSLDENYPYLIIVYTVDRKKYGIMHICNFSGPDSLFTLNLIQSFTSPDISTLFGYKYVYVGDKTEVQLPILSDDITKHKANCNEAGIARLGSGEEEICFQKNILTDLARNAKEDKTSEPQITEGETPDNFNELIPKQIQNSNPSNISNSRTLSVVLLILIILFFIFVFILFLKA